MPLEIERKFLVDKTLWQTVEKPPGDFFRQAYLVAEESKTVRVRITGRQAFLTIKGPTHGATRLEFEYEIPQPDAEQLLDNFTEAGLIKTRYKITYEGKLLEVDEFAGDNAGLLIAEIELTSEDEKFSKPAWIAEEVTGQEKYYNSKLSVNPFKNW